MLVCCRRGSKDGLVAVQGSGLKGSGPHDYAVASDAELLFKDGIFIACYTETRLPRPDPSTATEDDAEDVAARPAKIARLDLDTYPHAKPLAPLLRKQIVYVSRAV